MNELIRDMAEEAGFVIEGDRIYVGDMFSSINDILDDFVDMIVTECMEVVLESDPSSKMSLTEPYGTIIDNIKTRFGLNDDG